MDGGPLRLAHHRALLRSAKQEATGSDRYDSLDSRLRGNDRMLGILFCCLLKASTIHRITTSTLVRVSTSGLHKLSPQKGRNQPHIIEARDDITRHADARS